MLFYFTITDSYEKNVATLTIETSILYDKNITQPYRYIIAIDMTREKVDDKKIYIIN